MSEKIPFTKMSGAGNDFLVLDSAAWEMVPDDRTAWVRAVCRRGLSVGADGVLVVSPKLPGVCGSCSSTRMAEKRFAGTAAAAPPASHGFVGLR